MAHDSGECSLVTVIDDDQSVRESLPELLRESGYEVETFASAEAFLASGDLGRTKCLVLDVALPGMSGPELHRELRRRGQSMPVVFITAHGGRTMLPRLLEQGAVDCLCKPFTDSAFLAAVGAALRVARGTV
jgi:FixJ family two-component response regulator